MTRIVAHVIRQIERVHEQSALLDLNHFFLKESHHFYNYSFLFCLSLYNFIVQNSEVVSRSGSENAFLSFRAEGQKSFGRRVAR